MTQEKKIIQAIDHSNYPELLDLADKGFKVAIINVLESGAWNSCMGV